jgi:hypothetical protein
VVPIEPTIVGSMGTMYTVHEGSQLRSYLKNPGMSDWGMSTDEEGQTVEADL